MPPNGDKATHTKVQFYQEDIVQRVDNPSLYGVVLRCWHDAEDFPPVPSPSDPLLRPLQRGEVGVSFFPNHRRDILPESDFILVDRLFEPGNLCKRSVDDMKSGIVTKVDIKFKVQHAISGAPVNRWMTIDDVEPSTDSSIGDYVAFNDWIGQVQEMFDESTVEISEGQLVRLPEISARLTVGDTGADILPSPPEGSSGIFGIFMRHARPSQSDTVIAVKHTVLAIAWVAINQSLTPEEASERQRPPRFWHGADMSKLTILRGLADLEVRVGDKLTLKAPPKDIITRHGREDDPGGMVEVATFMVRETQTMVTVMWQDGKEEKLRSTDLIPYLNADEYDCWPGDHVLWKTEDEKRAAIVQSVDAFERTASLLLPDGTRELASVLELDPHGSDTDLSSSPESFGVHRGDSVFIHREGTTNGCEKPRVPRIGELEGWAQEPPSVDEHGHLSGWRKELDSIGTEIAHARGKDGVVIGTVRRPTKGDPTFNWFGEVSHLRLDGKVEVTLSDSSVVVVPLERLTRLHDGLEQLQDMWGDELSEGGHSYGEGYDYSHGEDDILEIQDEDGQWQVYDDDDDGDWEEEDNMGEELAEDNMDVDDGISFTVSSLPPDSHVAEPLSNVSPSQSADTPTPPPIGVLQTSDIPPVASHAERDPDSPDISWKRFDILPSAPPDHAFFGTTPSQPSKAFLGRLSKEYRVLSSSLPESIIVRVYEDRTDLLRCLIIGPENTPYEDAPFVIDWMLDSNFPQSPPLAHFLSWTNGNGRVNPNLYEEGKVCLSILGTWAGDRSESWSAARSSLLQAFVSIQGLVLVKEPWFCEPAYEKLRGTEEGTVNSRLYSEKAYVLSRGFVRRALEIPLGGLEDEIKEIYYTNGKLKKVLDSSRALIQKSKNVKETTDDKESAVPRLTAGGVITLTRTLDKLDVLLHAYHNTTAT